MKFLTITLALSFLAAGCGNKSSGSNSSETSNPVKSEISLLSTDENLNHLMIISSQLDHSLRLAESAKTKVSNDLILAFHCDAVEVSLEKFSENQIDGSSSVSKAKDILQKAFDDSGCVMNSNYVERAAYGKTNSGVSESMRAEMQKAQVILQDLYIQAYQENLKK